MQRNEDDQSPVSYAAPGVANAARTFGTQGIVLAICFLVCIGAILFYAGEASLSTLTVLCEACGLGAKG